MGTREGTIFGRGLKIASNAPPRAEQKTHLIFGMWKKTLYARSFTLCGPRGPAVMEAVQPGHGERALGVESGGIQQKAVVPELRKSVGAGEIPTTLVLGDELSDGSAGML